MKRLLILLVVVPLYATFSQTKSVHNSPPLMEATPASQGMSPERLARIDAIITESMQKSEIPGAVALVARNGKIVYYKAFGMADAATGRAFKRDDIFRIASQTKAITATAIMMLWEEGRFQLDDPIEKYIPEFAHPMVFDSLIEKDSTFIAHPADKSVTIRHLITHTSGIGYGMIDDDNFKKIYQKAGIIDGFTTSPITIEENVKKLAKLPLHFEPGSQWHYSEGLDVLGYFVEKISGMPFDKFLREHIFDPLGMADTWFYLPDTRAARLVPVQTKKEGAWVRYPVQTWYDPDYPVKGARKFFAGGAGLVSTPKDYATFLQMYLNGGELNGVRLLSRTTVNVIMANQIGDLWGNGGEYYGLAFGVLDKKGEGIGGRNSEGTFQWGGYFNTQYFADPKEKVIGILMKQTQDTDDSTGWKFRLLVGQAIDD